MVALFSKLDLGMLVCMQICPYQSWTNPAEGVMSTLNLALQNVSLMRDSMDDSMERAIKYKSNLTAIRATIEEKPELEQAIQKSIAPVIDFLNKRFSHMKLKGSPIKVCQAAMEDEVTFELVYFIDSSLSMGDLSQEYRRLAAFMKDHCSSTRYFFQVKKCGKNMCCYCSLHPVHLPQSEFDRLHFVPLPLMNAAKDHYKKLEELFGMLPSEVDRPSLASSPVLSEAKKADRENSLLPK